jgi:hypothetical protein
MHDIMQLLKKIADRGSWSQFATLLAFALMVAQYKSVTHIPRLVRLLIAVVSLVVIAFCLECVHRRFFVPVPRDQGPRASSDGAKGG